MEDPVFLHPSSILRHSSPEWIVYQVHIIHYSISISIVARSIVTEMYVLWTAIGYLWTGQSVRSRYHGDRPAMVARLHSSAVHVFCTTWIAPSSIWRWPRPGVVSHERYFWSERLAVACYGAGFPSRPWPFQVLCPVFPQWRCLPSTLQVRNLFFKISCNLITNLFFLPWSRYANILLSPPSTMVKTWARLQPRTQVLLQELINHNVDSYESLLTAWQKDKLYLLSAYQAWLPESQHEPVASLWPPV